ncbi:hypothetical protein SAMN05216464_108249 [Mucilaginibacter pineti]|uniref:Uncharacterized protein n=1 Tax=Mucilaginibacter pineti TaxID=1391627 RepID=A0A1G7F190_9SPHI|nr:hypothetical protein SAMN05216464_108249 [Mucilaginibacter pineti]
MLLTVFGMLSEEMVIKGKSLTCRHANARTGYSFSSTTASKRESIVLIH